MKYQLTFNEYYSSSNNILQEKIDYESINCIKLKMNKFRKQLSIEQDPKKRKKLQLKIKICELKIMIASIK